MTVCRYATMWCLKTKIYVLMFATFQLGLLQIISSPKTSYAERAQGSTYHQCHGEPNRQGYGSWCGPLHRQRIFHHTRLNYFTNLYQGSPIELFLANDKFRIYVCRWVKERSQCTGIIMGQRESNRKQHNLVVTCSKFISSRESKLLDPLPKVYIKPCSVKFHFMEWANGFVLVCFRSYRGWIFVA